MTWFRKSSASLAVAPSFTEDHSAEQIIPTSRSRDLDWSEPQAHDLITIVVAELRIATGHAVTEHSDSRYSVPIACVWLEAPLPIDFLPSQLRSELRAIGNVITRNIGDNGLAVLLAAHHRYVDSNVNVSPLAILTYNMRISEHFSLSNTVVIEFNKQFRKEIPVPTFYLDAATREIFHVHHTSLERYGDPSVRSIGPKKRSIGSLVSTNRQRVVALATGLTALVLTLVAVLLSDRLISTCFSGASLILAILAIKLLPKSSTPNHSISS